MQRRRSDIRAGLPNPRDARPFARRGRPARPQTRAQRRLQGWLTGFCIVCAGVILVLLWTSSIPRFAQL